MIVLYIQCTDYSTCISFISFYINCFWQSRISRSERRGTGRGTPRISCLPCQRRTTQSICAGKISPQTSSSNTLTQFFIVSRLPKMPTRIQCAFSFFFRYLLICFQFILPAFTFWVTREWFRWQDYWTLRFWFRGQAEGVVKKKTFTDYFQELMNPSSFPKSICKSDMWSPYI